MSHFLEIAPVSSLNVMYGCIIQTSHIQDTTESIKSVPILATITLKVGPYLLVFVKDTQKYLIQTIWKLAKTLKFNWNFISRSWACSLQLLSGIKVTTGFWSEYLTLPTRKEPVNNFLKVCPPDHSLDGCSSCPLAYLLSITPIV